MINANDARKFAEENKEHTVQVNLLKNHFEQLIKRASNAGKFTIDKQTFPEDRFKEPVITEVVEFLEENGYKASIHRNNALQQIVINVSW